MLEDFQAVTANTGVVAGASGTAAEAVEAIED
jgi:hypothetical protein